MSNRTPLLASLGLLLLAGTAQAQTPKPGKPLPIMRGAIQDTLGRPLEGAMIEIAGLDRRITTTASGSYRFDEIKPGKYWVIARRIGYGPLRAALSFNRGDDRELVFQLEPLPQKLADLEVTAKDRQWASRYQDFKWRSRGAFGYFLTRDDLEKTRSPYLGDVVRRYLPHVRTENYFTPGMSGPMMGWLGGQTSRQAGGFRQTGCSPAVSLNGAPPIGVWAVNDFRPQEVEAIEVYRPGRMMPAEFTGWNTSCGLVVVWTQ